MPRGVSVTRGTLGSRSGLNSGQFLENMFVRKREVEHRRQALWDSTAKYFDRHQREAKLFANWNSPEAAERSAQAYTRTKIEEAHRSEAEVDPHERPAHIVNREERRFIEAVNSGIVHQGSKDMQKERAIYRERRQMEQNQEAAELMQQHWKINDPGFKDLQCRKSNAFVKLPTDEELHRAKISFLSNEEEVTENSKEDLQKLVDEENRVFEEQVNDNVSDLNKSQLAHWKEAIFKYIDDSKALKAKEEQIQIELSQDVALEMSINEIESKRKKFEQKRKEPEADNFMRRQYRLKLTAMSKLVESRIEEDHRLVEELQTVLRSNQVTEIYSKVNNFKEQLNQQKFQELTNRRDLGLLFSEEAAKMWTKQSQLWSEEELERVRKFYLLCDESKEIVRIRIQSKRRSIESCRNSRQSIEETIDKLTKDLKEEEENERHKKQERLAFEMKIEDLEDLHLKENDSKPEANVSMENRFRMKNELAHQVAGWSAERFDEPECGDFRRKKVQWFY